MSKLSTRNMREHASNLKMWNNELMENITLVFSMMMGVFI